MLTRSLRQELLAPSGAPEVGPGSYDPLAPAYKPRNGMAPFNSTTERQTVGVPSFATPGPGSYVHAEVRKPLKPSPQFMSKELRIGAERERMKAHQTPGPGAYTGDLVKELPATRNWVDSKKDTKLSWAKIATVPSIPALGQSHGYEEATTGELVQQPPPVLGHTGETRDLPGPGEYNPTLPKKSNKGTSFSHGSANRVVGLSAPKNPGPGSYEADQSGSGISFRGGVMATRPSSMFKSTTARSKLSGGENGPGPANYKPPSSFTSLREHLAKNPESFHAFGNSGKQPHVEKGDTQIPGPGSYDTKVVSIDTKRGITAAFTSASQRFNKTQGDMPGPGSYEANDTNLTNNLGKKLRGRFGAFGSSSTRFAAPDKNQGAEPGSYDIKEPANPSQARRRDKRTGAFRSSSVRKDATPKTEGAPVFYERPSDWPKASTTSNAFISSVPRFQDVSKGTNPAPGSYEASTRIGKKSLKPDFGKANRFDRAHAEDVPGPGTYNTTPSMTRKTFNITIGDAWE